MKTILNNNNATPDQHFKAPLKVWKWLLCTLCQIIVQMDLQKRPNAHGQSVHVYRDTAICQKHWLNYLARPRAEPPVYDL